MDILGELLCFINIVFLVHIRYIECNILPEASCEVYSKPGNFTLAGIFPFRRSSGDYCVPGTTFWGLQVSEAMIWAIEEINKREDVLPNITIGYEIRDDCRTEDSALWAALSFFTDTCHIYQDKTDANLIGIIGGAFSSTSVFISKVANLYQTPFISFSATSDELSDKERFPYFLRTLPPDRYQVGVFMDIILKYNWKYIALVYSADTYGIHGATQIKSLAEENGICLAMATAVQPHAPQAEIDEVIVKLKRVPKAKVVIIFSLDDIADNLIGTIYKQYLNWNITWIASDGWGYESETNDWASILVGSFFIRFSRPHAPEFERYFSDLDPEVRAGSPWYKEYWNDWQIKYNCTDITKCPYDTAASGGPVIDAVYAFANALHNIYIDHCILTQCLSLANITGATLLEYLQLVTFNATAGPMQFDEYGDTLGKFRIQNLHTDGSGFKLVDAGYWDPREKDSPLVMYPEKVHFIGDSKDPPFSLCRDNCAPGYIVVPLEAKCCYGCQRCAENAIVVNQSECVACHSTEWPDATLTSCEHIQPTIINLLDPIILSILLLTALGLCFCCLTAAGLWSYRDHALMKATSRELSAVNVVGLGIAFAGVFPLLLEPTTVSCMLSEAAISLAFNFMFAPTFLKVTRIFRIFRAGKKSAQRPKYIGPRDQMVMVFLIISLQVRIV